MRKKIKEEPIEVTPVKLKPMFGLNPPVYLTIIYVSIFLILLFLIGFLPGIIKSGKRVTFTSPVAFSSVYVDSSYIGTSPITTSLAPGEHFVTYRYKDIASTKETIEVSRPLFLTWLIPRTQTVTSQYYLNEKTQSEYLDSIKKDIIHYSAVLEYDTVTHYPPLFESAISTIIDGTIDDTSTVDSFLLDSSLFITSKVMLDDMYRAIKILEDYSIDTTEISKEVTKISKLFEDEGRMSTPIPQPTLTSDTYRSNLISGDLVFEGTSFKESNIVVGSSVLLTYPGIEEKEQEVTVNNFSISNREISEYQYALFIEENNKWAKNNIDALIKEGLVDSSYLQGIYPTTSIMSNTPIRNISYYAAVAFSEWVAKKSGNEVMLPSNSEIELAIALSREQYQKSLFIPSATTSPIALLGGVWELTRDEYIPLERYLERTIENKGMVEDIIIKGGSYLNEPSFIDRASIGVMKKNQCSATSGFRIVWK